MALSEHDVAIRDQHIWSSDAGMIAEGKAGEVYLQKTGQKPKPNLDDVEAVQMGLAMQEPIMRIAAGRWGWEFKDADYTLHHPKHNWLASHFDYISADGKTLYEVKNLGVHQRKKYGEDGTEMISEKYRAQCLHEQIVHEGVQNIILVVLFGGQELCHYPQNFTALEAEAHIRAMAEFWAQVQTKSYNPQTMADVVGDVYKVDDGESMVANAALETACNQLAMIKAKMKEYEEAEEGLKQMIQSAMGPKAQLKAFDGSVLCTWKTSKPSKRFSADLLKQALPDTYEKFVVEQPGSRRFLIK
jgi:predicted phage-related endonuclease